MLTVFVGLETIQHLSGSFSTNTDQSDFESTTLVEVCAITVVVLKDTAAVMPHVNAIALFILPYSLQAVVFCLLRRN
jgi:hypothetical protein